MKIKVNMITSKDLQDKPAVNMIVSKDSQDKSIVDKIIEEIKKMESKYPYISHEFASLVMIDVDQIILEHQQRGYQIEKEFIIEDDIIINLRVEPKKKEEEKKEEEEID